MNKGKLSGFVGAWCNDFYGGPMVRELEDRWKDRFKCKNAISVNSNTSGLIAALGAMFGEYPLALSIELHGWQNAILGLTFIGVILTVVIALFLSNNKELKEQDSVNEVSSIGNDLKLILTNKYNWAIALYAFTCWGPVTSFAELWGVEFLKHHLEISKNSAAAVASSIWLGIAIGAPIIGYISTKKNGSFLSII